VPPFYTSERGAAKKNAPEEGDTKEASPSHAPPEHARTYAVRNSFACPQRHTSRCPSEALSCLALLRQSRNNRAVAKLSPEDKPVVVLRKKRPGGTTAASSAPVGKTPRKSSLPTRTPVGPGEAQLRPPLPTPVPAGPPIPAAVSAPAPPGAPASSGPTGAQRRRAARRERFVQSPEFAQIAAVLTSRWPHLFRVTPETIRPLAIGIADDLCTQLPDFPPGLVHRTLNQWMADHRVLYWKAVMQGGPRYALDGTPKGEVTPEQQASARQQRKAWYERRAQRTHHQESTPEIPSHARSEDTASPSSVPQLPTDV
jgi:hypothetical protein